MPRARSSSSATTTTRWKASTSARRERLDAGVLSVYTTHRSGRLALLRPRAARALRAAATRRTTSRRTRRSALRIDTRHRRLLVATDGEIAVMDTPLEYRVLPRALRVIVPADLDAHRRPPFRPALRPRRRRAARAAAALHRTSSRPHLVVVSGDLTQRARARAVPRGARVPRHAARAAARGARATTTCRSTTSSRASSRRSAATGATSTDGPRARVFIDDEIAVVGVNTARSLVFKGGRINEAQIERARARLCGARGTAVKILVTHHPFDLPPGHERGQLVGRARDGDARVRRCGADVLLSGHLHRETHARPPARYSIGGSPRWWCRRAPPRRRARRGEANSFNVLTLSAPRVQVRRYVWDEAGRQFSPGPSNAFERCAAGWKAG